jgi:hypothetical protein
VLRVFTISYKFLEFSEALKGGNDTIQTMTRAKRIRTKLELLAGYLIAWYFMAQSSKWAQTETGELLASAPFMLLVILLITDHEGEEGENLIKPDSI